MALADIAICDCIIQRRKQGNEPLKSICDSALGYFKFMIDGKLSQNPGKRALKVELAQKNHHPERYPEAAFLNKLWYRRRRDNPGQPSAIAGALITSPADYATMGANINFHNLRIFCSENGLQRQPATGTALLIFGKLNEFLYGSELLVTSATMAFGAGLLSPFAFYFHGKISSILFTVTGTFFRVTSEKLPFTKFDLSFKFFVCLL
ncbi:MAG: hypothetical protein EHM77_03855 [Planctomycetaceae bacterium]|nr:MAG: hypothetical protein EHM77_03855 [Planctomycetaceae bacterium]